MGVVGRSGLAGLVFCLAVLLSHCGGNQETAKTPDSLLGDHGANLEKDPWSQVRFRSTPGQKATLERQEAMADLFLQSQNLEGSMVGYFQILREQPHRYDIRHRVGVILLLSGQWEAARQEFATILTARPNMLETHEALGLVHLLEKNYPPAIEEFRLVLSRDSQRHKSRHLLGVTYLEAGKTKESVTELETAARMDPENVAVMSALGQAYHKLKDYPRSLVWLQKAKGLAPQSPKVNYLLGMTLASMKRYSEALQAFVQGSDEAQAYNNIGVHYFLEGRYEEAAKCFQKAIELRPTFYDEAKTNLNRALEKLQESKKDSS